MKYFVNIFRRRQRDEEKRQKILNQPKSQHIRFISADLLNKVRGQNCYLWNRIIDSFPRISNKNIKIKTSFVSPEGLF